MNFKKYYLEEGTVDLPQKTVRHITNDMWNLCYAYSAVHSMDNFPDKQSVLDFYDKHTSIEDWNKYIRSLPEDKYRGGTAGGTWIPGNYTKTGKRWGIDYNVTIKPEPVDINGALVTFPDDFSDREDMELRFVIPSSTIPKADAGENTGKDFFEKRFEILRDKLEDVVIHELTHLIQKLRDIRPGESETFYQSHHDISMTEFEPTLNEIKNIAEKVVSRRGEPLSKEEFRYAMKGNWGSFSEFGSLPYVDEKLRKLHDQNNKLWKKAVTRTFNFLQDDGLVVY